jgi:peroxiredoxin family protein
MKKTLLLVAALALVLAAAGISQTPAGPKRQVEMLRKTNTAYEQRLKQLADSGVMLAACQNAMRVMNIKTEDLFPFASQVDSGVTELVRKQEAVWASHSLGGPPCFESICA